MPILPVFNVSKVNKAAINLQWNENNSSLPFIDVLVALLSHGPMEHSAFRKSTRALMCIILMIRYSSYSCKFNDFNFAKRKSVEPNHLHQNAPKITLYYGLNHSKEVNQNCSISPRCWSDDISNQQDPSEAQSEDVKG